MNELQRREEQWELRPVEKEILSAPNNACGIEQSE